MSGTLISLSILSVRTLTLSKPKPTRDNQHTLVNIVTLIDSSLFGQIYIFKAGNVSQADTTTC